ncbi:stamen-specific protein fil1 [Phtheirospermum japonicum]|uniref:Stamen-specific protein fil1 n=1 Tax=Phtheirospermum japonicum TaxID=374723 RepID=A0A830BJ82_9LAMI|nr:stamen-specific protein fil1 [Phtheirospermum japonicum]
MAATKSSLPLVMLIVLMIAQSQLVNVTQAQSTCTAALTSLNVCAPFVVPGASSNPSNDCCGALQAVDHDCLCSTLRIAARIPAQCNLPPLTCGIFNFP